MSRTPLSVVKPPALKPAAIEYNVPIPIGFQRQADGVSGLLRQLAAAELGASIMFPTELASDNTIRSIAHKVLGTGSFVTRKVEGGLRVWRTVNKAGG